MDQVEEDLKIYSEEVKDILSAPPKSIVRWGSTIVLCFIALMILLAYIIKYPDIVTADIIITTATPPEKLIAKSSGNLEKILVNNNELIKKGTPVAIIENTADYEDVLKLKRITDTITLQNEIFYFPFEKLKGLKLGEIASSYAMFEKEYTLYRLNNDLNPYNVEKVAQGSEVLQLQQRLSILVEQLSIAKKELLIKKRELERFEKLHNKGVIATQEWDIKNLEYYQFEKDLKNLVTSISQTKSSIIDIKRNSQTTKINETRDDVNLYKNAVQSFRQLKEAIAKWELSFVLRSSIDGTVSFLKVWKENQNVVSGDNVFAVIPNNDKYIGKVTAIAQNSGKIKKGQSVNIRLANYPDREFGMLIGKVDYIALTPDTEGNILIDVSLPDKLNTSYNKEILFQQEMSGSASIITEDLRLIERLLYQFRDLYSHY
ncbi:HlyD family secretion protein [Flavobacterium sp. C4GT6]|uniref:HlyD family secretion protein n=1 Tax=Flavobacterium sp. C4GT6 TaxID=3103818 RepID=UPI002ED31622